MPAWWTALRASAPPVPADLDAWWSWHRQVRAPTPFARAVLASARADRAGMAFVSGYQAALQHLLGDHGLAALAVTEAEGNHPRAIHTTIVGGRISGTKTFVTLGDVADTVWVVARDPSVEGHRPRLVVARVQAGGPGQAWTPGPPTPFVPEVAHGQLVLDNAPVVQVREADGYDEVVKPFRTVEDLHVLGALLGYTLGEAQRSHGDEGWREQAMALVVALGALCAESPSDTAVHLALAGVWHQAEALLSAAPLTGEAATRWQRDRALLSVASTARKARADRAWDTWRG